MSSPLRIAVLASGRGSNLQALIVARDAGKLPVEFVLVGSDKAQAGALELAEAAGIPRLVLNPKAYPSRRAFDLDLFSRIEATGADLLVLAGYMICSARAWCDAWLARTTAPPDNVSPAHAFCRPGHRPGLSSSP